MTAKPTRRPRPWDHLHLAILLLLLSAGLTVLISAALYLFIALDIPDITSLESYRPAETTLVYDRQGRVAALLFHENRTVVPLAEMPPLLPQAFIAAEDARFYDHLGVDGWSVFRALVSNLRAGERRQGGSTITQQVARDLLLSREKTYTRKIKEAILAYRIDRALSKNEIIHIYLNQIYLGSGAYGVEAAARTYFDKSAKEMNLAEISLLAGLPQAPSRYSPFRHYTLAKRRQAYVLNRMAEDGHITPTAARRAYVYPLIWGPPQEFPPENEYFLQQVKNQAEQRYGREMLYRGGLRIHTTLDQQLQQAASSAVREGIAAWKKRQADDKEEATSGLRPQAALLTLENRTGMVRAAVGGADFNESQFNRATQARRQPGSAFKPLIYAAALEKGMTPATILIDEPISLPGASRRDQWQPRNFGNRFYGPTTLRDGLVHSRNIVTIKILRETGLAPVLELARRLGISAPLSNTLSLALGVSEVSLLEMTGAYAAFANQGAFRPPHFITKITDRKGRILEQNQAVPRQALDPRTAYQLTRLLTGVIEDGTGRNAKGLGIATAGKTGTTDRYMDAWFIGYTPELTTGVWMGFDQKRSLGKNETGGRAAAPIWLNFMQQTKNSYPAGEFPMPEGIVMRPVYNPLDRKEAEEGENWEEPGSDLPGMTDQSRQPAIISWEAFRTDNLPPKDDAPAPGE